MAKTYTGINNYNEYYTNHYFSSIFEENASATISAWRDSAKASENVKTPWSQLKEDAKAYYTAHDDFVKTKGNSHLILIKEMADRYINSLGYFTSSPIIAEIDNDLKVPVYKEIKNSNGTPLLWIVLSNTIEDDEDVLYGNLFDGNFDEENDDIFINKDFNAEDLITKALFANENPPRWVIAIGMNGIALIDRNKWSEKRYLSFDLKELFARREDSCLQAMSVLLHRESLCPIEGNSLLDDLNENSNKHAAGISQDLKYALRECIELLGNEVIYYYKKNDNKFKIDPSELTLQCLRYMYRMLFVLFIEARPELGYAPMKDIAYATGYSLEKLRDIVDDINEDTEEIDNGYYLSDSINKLFNIIYNGYPSDQEQLVSAEKMESIHHAFIIEPLKAHIFDPELTSLISNSKLRNSVMIKIIRLMSISRSDRTGRGRISYSNLGINQLGSVYEALLSYRGFIAEHTLYEVKRAGDNFDELDVGYFVSESELENYTEEERVRYEKGPNKGKPRKYEQGTFIYRLAGREREKSASYYTPEVLTKCLVKYALKELLENKTADEILNLKICEPAMGSAAFLNETINQLADAYINKKQEELNDLLPYESRYNEVQKVKMYIADRNIYGVDLNSTAVELAEVSLWLNTIFKGQYVPWFGTQIVNGNSLIGARRQVYNTEQLKATNSNLQWFNNEPTRVMPGEQRQIKETKVQKKPEVYHFLLGDPGMCAYNDKVIKTLEKENIETMKKWNKEFVKPCNPDEIESLLRISSVIDNLWAKQVELRKEIELKTADKLSIYGHEDTIEDSHTTIRQKDKIYRQLYKSEKMNNAGPYARLKFAMDYWCALWFWPIDKAELLPSRSEYIYDMSLILEGGIMSVKQEGQYGKYTNLNNGQTAYQTSMFDTDVSEIAKDIQSKYSDLGQVNLDQLCETEERLALVRQIANENHFMHWELEFADLFEENGGFDLMIGNPPWIRVDWTETSILADINPLFVIRDYSATQLNNNRNNILLNPKVKKSYLNEYCNVVGMQKYIDAIQNYFVLKGQRSNLYKCFLPLSWKCLNSNGYAAYIHPNGIFDDPSGGQLRREVYHRLKYHFRFQNEMKLFQDVGNRYTFSLNIYHPFKNVIEFKNISNLFVTSTIDECLDDNNKNALEGIKDSNGNWNKKGNRDRCINISRNELIVFANLFDNNKNYEQAKLPNLHAKQLISVLKCFVQIKEKISNYEHYSSTMWNETNAQKDGIIKRNVHFASSIEEVIYSGPHIGVGNPIYKTSQKNCSTRRAFDNIDLTTIDENYIQRTNYVPNLDIKKYFENTPITQWNEKYIDLYRVVSREMANNAGEHTLFSAIIPPKTSHIITLFGVAFRDIKNTVLLAGLFASLPYDFYVKATGKAHVNSDLVEVLPFFENNKIIKQINNRVLLLNCLNGNYKKLWETIDKDAYDCWSINSRLLNNDKFAKITEQWKYSSPLRDDYSRRIALIELDVLVAMLLKMNLEQLIAIYKIQFPVLCEYENNTWYDQNGRIVFTINRSLTGVGFDRNEWEQIKNAKPGEKFYRTIIDDTMSGGPIERTIEYVAPFYKCDRIEDYKTAWEFFTKKYESEE